MLKYKKVVKKVGQKMKLTYEAYAKINLILDVTGVKKMVIILFFLLCSLLV